MAGDGKQTPEQLVVYNQQRRERHAAAKAERLRKKQEEEERKQRQTRSLEEEVTIQHITSTTLFGGDAKVFKVVCLIANIDVLINENRHCS